MLKSKLLAIGSIILFANCGGDLKASYNSEIDQAYDGFEALTYLEEGGNIIGPGEAVNGLLKTASTNQSFKILPINYAMVPEDTYVKIIYDDRYDLGRLQGIEIEVRFPEETKVKLINIVENYSYSTTGGDSAGDLDKSKPVAQGGELAHVEVNYRHEIAFEKFKIKIAGLRTFNEDPTLTDFTFYDTSFGVGGSVSKITTQGSFSGAVGTFSRFLNFDTNKIADFIKSYSKDTSGKVTGAVSGDSGDGIILMGNFEINTMNTPCLFDDTGTYHYTINYPKDDELGRKTETADYSILLNGVYDAVLNLEKQDGSTQSKTLHRVLTRPSGCDVMDIRQTGTLTGTDYSGGAVEMNETRVREFSHIYGKVTSIEEQADKVDLYRVSGQVVYR